MAAINGKQVKRQISSERLKPLLESRKTEGRGFAGLGFARPAVINTGLIPPRAQLTMCWAVKTSPPHTFQGHIVYWNIIIFFAHKLRMCL